MSKIRCFQKVFKDFSSIYNNKMDNINTNTKSKGRGRPKTDETSANLWEDPSYHKDYIGKYYEQSKAKIGMSKCEECGFDCATNYTTKHEHKKTKYHLKYIARKEMKY